MKITFIGTGDAKQVPVWGCDCKACIRARVVSNCQRKSSCILVEIEDKKYLLDAGPHTLVDQYQPSDLSGILLSHFHIDHLMGMFHMRWGKGETIPVHCPRDKLGCADLYKHSGLFKFEPFKKAFSPITINPLQPQFTVTAVPLNHSKETLGYALEADGSKLAYLCDTKGLPVETLRFLIQWQPDAIIIDCTFAPNSPHETSNHNSYQDVLDIRLQLLDHKVSSAFWLTHIAHDMDEFLIDEWSVLPDNVFVAQDNGSFTLNAHQTSQLAVNGY